MRQRAGLVLLKLLEMKNTTKAFFMLGIGFFVTVVLLVSFISKTNSLATKLDEGAKSQLINRAINVETWCEGGINEGRRYDRKFVEGFHIRYTLGDKDCEAIIRKTLESPKHKSALSPTSTPLTYRVVQQLKHQHK